MQDLRNTVISSMEVAEMVEKKHCDLLRDIRKYCTHLAESKIALGDFFSESTYLDANNQSRPCYLVTKKGCEFIAHKLTGQRRGVKMFKECSVFLIRICLYKFNNYIYNII